MLLLPLVFLAPHTFALVSWLGLTEQQPLLTSHDYDPFATQHFDHFINNTLTEFLTPGLAIAVVHNNKPFSQAHGLANLATNDPVTPRTLFFTGSTTKSFTAATASKLVYSNESAYADITWTTRLADLIRGDFVLQDAYATNHIMLLDALSHRTGMPRHDMSWITNDPSLREQVRRLRYLPLHNELRTTWEYCNLMFTAVSHAIETITGKSTSDLLREWFWEPLGMHETFYDLDSALSFAESSSEEVTFARGYMYDNITTHALIPVPWSDIPPSNGAGGVISNVLDYTLWIKAFLHPDNTSSPLSAAAIETMTSAHMPTKDHFRPMTGSSAFYGLGLSGGVYRGYEIVGHNGAINGYMTTMLWIPALDWGVVIMQNAYSMANEVVLWRLLDDFLQTPEGERHDMAGVARALQAEKVESLAHAKEELYPEAGKVAAVAPARPLEAYEGVYCHPAYQNITLCIAPHAGGKQGEAADAPLPLYATPVGKSYLNTSATLHHVSGEYWWAHARMGPGSFLVDQVSKVEFGIGADGRVKGMGFQAEPAVRDLAWFEKVE